LSRNALQSSLCEAFHLCSEGTGLWERCEASWHRFVLDLVEKLSADGPAMVAHGRLSVLPTRLFSQQVGILVSMALG